VQGPEDVDAIVELFALSYERAVAARADHTRSRQAAAAA
jgi:hypothetical protein